MDEGREEEGSQLSSSYQIVGSFQSRYDIPPSICLEPLLAGRSYGHYSNCPKAVIPMTDAPGSEPTECVLGVDEAGRGPVLGPMVYSAFYLPLPLHRSLLCDEYHFDDSKVLTPAVRENLMQLLCREGHRLHDSCGWAIKLLSARDISAGMLRPGAGGMNLNEQAMEATIELIRNIVEQKAIKVTEVYIDTIGNPTTYQKKLEMVLPALKITVAKKADSLYPCVSAASVCAKVTRDVALQVLYDNFSRHDSPSTLNSEESWGSGYPSDSKCTTWLKQNMHSVFGWGSECRFSWGTAKEFLDDNLGTKVDWPDDNAISRVTQYFVPRGEDEEPYDELRDWYGRRVDNPI
ncbi:hypothetical protein KEM54_000569 [Ascosphaera aggregata]|nr:hypothetical protein KEM54_000569 [Ascosphaera aggregata]